MTPITVQFLRRELPLSICGAAGFGDVAVELARRVLERGALVDLVVGEAPVSVLAVGQPSEIPWVDGLIWLGRDPEASELLFPTTTKPSLHPALLRQVVGEPAALLPDDDGGGFWIPLAGLQRVHHETLAEWLAGR